jgi:RNA polymerase primary sigma factor
MPATLTPPTRNRAIHSTPPEPIPTAGLQRYSAPDTLLALSRPRTESAPMPSAKIAPQAAAPEAIGDSANLWLQQAARAGLLNFEQEQALARRLTESRTPQDYETARQALICANLRLVAFVARRFKSASLTFDDLVQEGAIGLIQAVDRFDYRQGVRFSTYALWWIRQAILRALAERGALIRVPTHVQTSVRRLQQTHRQLSDRLGRAPSLEEWTQAAGMTEEQVNALLSRMVPIVSLDAPVGQEQETRLADLLPAPETSDPLLQVTDQSMGQTVRQALKTLSPQEREILGWRYGLEGEEPRSLEEISRTRRVTRERVRQLEARALQKLRRHPLLQERDRAARASEGYSALR